MFRTKKDVDRHVVDILSKIHSENEKNLRGYTFARLYFQAKDFESAKRYLSGFLKVRDHHAPGHKLMGQIHELNQNLENALQSYKRSLEIDSRQNEVVLKICELYCRLPVDHETARYWADRAEDIYPHNEVVFKLRECLVSADGEADHQELEKLIATELQAQPKNISLRIRLLRLYLDTERLTEAYDHATMIESKRLFPWSVEWYYLLGDIFEAYQEEYSQNLDSQFYLQYLTALDRHVFLTLAEPHSLSNEDGKKYSSVNDAAAVLLTFDQVLKSASEKDEKDGSWKYFVHHMKGQLYYYMTSLLLKRTKLDQGNRKEALRFSSGLAVVCYTFKPMNLLQELWFLQMDENQKAFTNFFQQGSLRTSFIGHIIMDMCKEDKSKWLQKLKLEVCLTQVKERIYSRVFNSVIQKDKLLSSYFILDSTFEDCSLEFPSDVALLEYDKAAYKLCPNSLHHLVWFELHRQASNGPVIDYLPEVFKGLQYSNKNLSKGSCESLCVLDLEAYLFASVYQSQAVLEKKKAIQHLKSQGSQLSYPPDIADAMCSKQQASWWRAAYGLHFCSVKEKFGEFRRELQRGLEVIRGIGNHGMEVQLVVFLARKFADKADLLKKNSGSGENKRQLIPENVTALQSRSLYYWKIALGMLEKLSAGQTLGTPKEQMFTGFSLVLSKNEIKTLLEDGKLYIAVYLMDSEKLDDAAELLSTLSTPYGSYYLALTLKRLASQEEHFSKTRTALLSRAKNSVHETMDRIKDDKSHPLNQELYVILEDVENELATDLTMGNSIDNEEEDEVDAYNNSPELNSSLYMSADSHRSATHSTPRPSSKFMSTRPKSQLIKQEPTTHFEPSPERLDAQIRALTLNQDTFMKTLLEQQKSFLETNKSIAATLQQSTEVLEQLRKSIDELKISGARNQPKGSSRKHSYIKGQGDEEDYNAYESSLLEFYTEEGNEDYRTSAYGYNPSSRMVHDAAAPLNYVMSPAIPQGPPPALNYNYQYPHHPVLPAPPVAERSPFYHPPPGQGLPFSEGQQLPQFHFHVASPVVKPTPPIMSSVASLPQGVTLPPPPPPTVHPPQSVIPPSAMSMPGPWSKTVTVPHAFQIPLPASTQFPPPPAAAVVPQQTVTSVSNPSAMSTHSDLKSLLKASPAQETISFSPNVATAPTTMPTTNVSIFAGICKTPEFAKLERSRCDSDNAGSPDIDGHDIEREVMGDFKPLIPLPAEIVVETGEENEVVLFEDRAKLYRYVDSEWKERGIGVVKILHDDASGRVRLLMRRDQVLKVCANHYLNSNMEIQPLKSSDKAWTWLAQDFADEELRPEHFCIRFKTVELADAFKGAFDKALTISKENEKKKLASPRTSITQTDTSSSLKPFGANLFPKAGSWTCTACYVSNAPEKLLCVACETKKPGSQTAVDSSSARTNPTETSVPSPVTPFKMGSNEKPFVFTTPTAVNTDMFSSRTPPVPANTPKSTFGGFTFSSSPTICETETPEVKDREILVVSTKSKNGLQVTKVNQLPTSPFSNFSFVKSPPQVTTSSALTVQFSDNARNVSIKNDNATLSPIVTPSSTPTVKFSDKISSSANASITSTTAQSTGIQSANEGSLSKMMSMIKNIDATYTFDKKDSTTSISASDLLQKTSSPSPLSKASGKSFVDGEPEEFVPTAEFKPVVPLPALVDLKTGEEEEENVFGERAKLFRYDLDSKEWKERGVGELKILYQRESDKYRILMRRDVIFKLCANHYILPEMKLSPLSNNEKSWVWFAQDYSDGDLKQEQFAARFKTTEIARRFHEVFQKCQSELTNPLKANPTSNKPSTDPCAGNAEAFDQLLKAATDSWECPSCHKSNMNFSSCVYCRTPKPSIGNVENKPLSELFKPQIGSWECEMCLVRNESSNDKCASCESQKPGTSKSSVQDPKLLDSNAPLSLDKNRSIADMFKPQPGSWECSSCLVRNSADKTKCASCETSKDGTASSATENKPFGSFTFGSASVPNTYPFSFGTPKASTGDFVFGPRAAIQPTTFSFGHSTVKPDDVSQTVGFKPSLPASNAPEVFGGITQKQLPNETNNSTNSVFGSSNTTKFDFSSYASPKKSEGEPQEFRFGSPQKYEFSFTGVRPRSPARTPKSPRSPATPSDIDDEDVESNADSIYFTPVIALPPEVDVKTGEENEKTLFCKRAKLFRFANCEWKERGIGDIKILLDEKSNKLRLLMRREQVLKVCLNHNLTKDIKFEWRGDKTLSWAATDFSENEASPELFAMRFKTSELANEFKSAITTSLESVSESSSQNDRFVLAAASSFSFKTDTPKVESNFSSGSLSSRFGTSVQEKSVFGNTGNFSFSDSPLKTSPFGNIFKDKVGTSSFFGQPSNTMFGGSKLGKDGVKFNLGVQAEEKLDPDVQLVYEASASKEQIERAEKLRLPKNFFLFEESEASCLGCIGCTDTIPPYKDITAEESKAEEPLCLKKEILETPPAAEESNTLFSNSKLQTFSFTDLASSGTFENLAKTSPSSKNVFAGAGAPIFSNLNNSTEDGNDDVSQGPDVHFEPVIPLPDLIEVKTGEEDESELFVQRAKLFRFDSNTKQWKERGIGDIKILRHKQSVRFRVILRRDQVHNIACNHCISEEMSLTPLATSETALCWNALDFSDGKGVASQFAVRFKHKEQMNKFKQIFTECQELLRISRELAKGTVNKISEIVKKESENLLNYETSPESIGNLPNNETDHGNEEQNSTRNSEDDEEEDIQFEKRATLEIYDDVTKTYKNAGVGTLKITYDDAVYGYHISMSNDQGKILCDHIIAVQTCLRTEGKKALWSAIELSSETPMRRQYRASFCSLEALNEFQISFEEGKQIAIESVIVEKSL